MSGRVPVAQDSIEVGGKESFFIYLYANTLDAHWAYGLRGGGEGVLFGQDTLPTCDEHSVGQVEGRRAADVHAALPVLVRRIVYDL